MASAPVNKRAHFVQHRGRGEPARIVGRQRVHPAKLVKELVCQAADFLRRFEVHAVLLAHGEQGVATFCLNLLARHRSSVVVSEHLSQQSIPKPQRRITEAGQIAAFHKLGKDEGARHNDFCPPRPDSRHSAAFLRIQPRQALRKVQNDGAWDLPSPGPEFAGRGHLGRIGECRGGP